ncbi:Cytochrome c551 peroxidase precursor [Pseudovibrio axinellae]|uniref:Cytochrome c551 peroxidase n=1 Tax=Pseudovibrio axinellae TaxID=989403 RepID=A0A165XPR2_9HYPH|nr:cytochrome c peroxidase [Pseudovibrio axinellae]KZL17923.1 Cytochrome c551 peroxidase precursor [Pseudovibrio axinellae]SER57753.1 cytochrome c peroxidase [Pseudovibrio axinellae]
MTGLLKAILSALLCLSFSTLGVAEVILTADETAQVLSHGPWPHRAPLDVSNRLSGNELAIELGQILFSSQKLSKNGQMSCVSCHDPALGFTERKQRSVGRELLKRNTSSLYNITFHHWFGWAGENDSLWAQSLRPILSTQEMAMSLAELADLTEEPEFSELYQGLFPDFYDHSEEDAAVNLAKALAAYQETLVTGRTSFDAFRDALASGDLAKAGQYPLGAQRGFQIFAGKGRCTFCHVGPFFSNGEFHDIGLPYFLEEGGVDGGRTLALKELKTNPYTLASTFSDDPQHTGAWRVDTLIPRHSDFGIFRVPSLRNLNETAPYMHDGSKQTLADVARHYSQVDIERLHADGEAIIRPFDLSEDELFDLVAFLESLSLVNP